MTDAATRFGDAPVVSESRPGGGPAPAYPATWVAAVPFGEPDEDPDDDGDGPGGGDGPWDPDKDPTDPRRERELVPA